MKYMEIPELARLAQALAHEGPECSVHTRLEAYSLKPVNKDKKLFKSLEAGYQSDASHSPPLPSFMAQHGEQLDMTPFGPMGDQHARKTLYLLINTLNHAFPDHDFSDVRPSHFNREENGASVLNALSTTLLSPARAGLVAPRTYSAYPSASPDFFPSSVPTSSSPHDAMRASPLAPPRVVAGTHPTVFRVLDAAIGLGDCEVYSYAPPMHYDPHAHDFDDDEDDAASAGDESPDTDEEETTFQFDDYDVDEAPAKGGYRIAVNDAADEFTPHHIRMRRRGALLWSSHWFFLNRKLKRILFITVWARSKGLSAWTDEMEEEEKAVGERFFGWEGAVGAGARAMGLSVTV
ncbi:Maf1-domain-containing protein [Phanerochaete sordida]|uniref:Repressor of RNA polymerase III transcription MAF1 n=1 Tax=Phanerochaete sordida TaxID=48140 RepID=A0A9P3GT50_9APHY|nr:Maf1-domain-containing protein [Phanerochaete sordida]